MPVVASDVLLGGLVSDAYVGKPCPDRASLIGTPAFGPLGDVLSKPGGWDKLQGVLKALAATGVGVETAMVQLFVDAGMRAVVHTELTGPPPFKLGGEPLSTEHAASIKAAMSA